MADPNRNACIWYAADAFDPKSKGLNGRRVAGESFLRGFLQHAEVDVLQAIALGQSSSKEFTEFVEPYRRGRKVETYLLHEATAKTPISTINYPAPAFAVETWRRYHLGQDAFSICGVTHTTATSNIMNGLFDLRTSPVEEWDGIICTSQSVLEQVDYHLDCFDEYAGRRFGAKQSPRPKTHLIPLGIHTKDFEPDPKAGLGLREKLEIGADDVVFMVLSRLSAHEKFDPIPVYRAMALAQRQTGKAVHFILCGYFPDKLSEDVFRKGAAAAMPNVKLHVVDGKDEKARSATFSASDVFVFLIDNVQETFGLAPVEAMAAGLPVLVSDWDGMRDTVTSDVGFRVETRFPSVAATAQESFRHQVKTDSYTQYTTLLASMTQINVPAMARCMIELIQDPDLRKRMGAAAKKRAQKLYDWSAVIPQMQDFWGELSAIRHNHGMEKSKLYYGLDVSYSPNAGKYFESYPTHQGDALSLLLVQTRGASIKALNHVLETRGFKRIRRSVQNAKQIAQVFECFSMSEGRLAKDVAKQHRIPDRVMERCVLLLLKYDLLREAS